MHASLSLSSPVLALSASARGCRGCQPALLAAAVATLILLASPASGVDFAAAGGAAAPTCQGWVYADVVALDQVYHWNRLGAFQPHGMIYALEKDVVHVNQDEDDCSAPRLPLSAGQVKLRRDKRPRPLVLRMNAGECIQITFTNLLDSTRRDDEQPNTRAASIHVVGMQYVNGIADGGINLGVNPAGGVVQPGQTAVYTLYAQERGTYLMYSGGAMVGGEGDNGSIAAGLFGAINVEPKGAEYYRSQVTYDELAHASSPSPSGHPLIDYDATYDATFNPYCYANPTSVPVLRMRTTSNQIVHSDLTAIITGPDRGNHTDPGIEPVGAYPNRTQAFREFTIIFHDETGAVQAFPEFEDDVLAHTLHSVRDAFAINYGTGGIGAEILANRFKVGPMHDCVECKYEEFFLTSWAVGDPAMIVDRPANHPCTYQQIRSGTPCTPGQGRKATRVLYPDDPSNVYWSYLNDHVQFRNLHAGSDDHHVFHLHAHQWLHSPNKDRSSYKDSQAIGQAASFTYEIAYEGSGNRPKTPGDSIFHCHLYPHFAQGMWSLWRVLDTLEVGTELDDEGKPLHTFDGTSIVTQTRALPDGEIRTGTPIPAVVPIPGLPMAALPAAVLLRDGDVDWNLTGGPPTTNPGFPFFIPGKAGHRPPHPPLDTVDDGGLPRHVITAGTATAVQTRLNFDKVINTAQPLFMQESGQPEEVVAMGFHAQSGVTTPTPEGGSGLFKLNGLPPVAGAPYADPCPTNPTERRYKAANIQMDMVLNKDGWHFPQQRLITLWGDVSDTLYGRRPPEPFFFRANSNDCVEFHHTNLVPNIYELDDFQVRTPTDILGQHIHLVKFDVTSSDGSGNGFNYEDGTFSPEEVHERILAIRTYNGCLGGVHGGDPRDNNLPGNDPLGPCPVIEPHPYFAPQGIDANCDGVDDWEGAQTTIQRWWADPITRLTGGGNTLRTVFTHDHYGPSTHQQVGLYAGLIVEETGSTWYHNENGSLLGNRTLDGGPTSWQAVIDQAGGDFREFLLEFADFQLAYEPNDYGPPAAGELQIACPSPDPNVGYADPASAINPAGRKEIGLPYLFAKPDRCPLRDECSTALGPLPPCPEAISADDPGFTSVNYRSEPVALRVRDPNTNGQAPPPQGDLSFAYESRTDRADANLNGVTSPWVPYPNLTYGLLPGDPFTPLMRTYEGDEVKIRVLVGAHEEEHNFTINGMKWQHQPEDVNSGYKASQMMAISEWYDLEVGRQPSLFPSLDAAKRFADFLYRPSSSNDFQWNGAWGLFRVYYGPTGNLPLLGKRNPDGRALTEQEDEELLAEESLESTANAGPVPKPVGAANPRILCRRGAPRVTYNVVAVWAGEVLPQGRLIFNSRDTTVTKEDLCTGAETFQGQGPLYDDTAILFLHAVDWDPIGRRVNPGVKIEPLILRAHAGECIQVNLTNEILPTYADRPGYSGVPMIVEQFNANQVSPSLDVSLHPQLVAYDVRQSDGVNVGYNRVQYNRKQTVAPGQSISYFWFAGELKIGGGPPRFREIELGATALVSADPIKHTNKGAIGALIIEPKGATWTYDLVNDPTQFGPVMTRASATVTVGQESFREFVVLFQDDLNLRYDQSVVPQDAVPNLHIAEDPTETGQSAFNYRTEPIWFRTGVAPDTHGSLRDNFTQFDQVTLNSWIGGLDPETPLFAAEPGQSAIFRVVHPGGDTQNHSFEIQGHLWQEEPYTNSSTTLGVNPDSNWLGARSGVGTGVHFDALLDQAGGAFQVDGDYMYRDYTAWGFDNGLWSIFRVEVGAVPPQMPPPELP